MPYKEIHDFIIKLLREKLPPQLSYHSVEHTIHTLDVVEEIAAGENISDAGDLLILRLAALLHDVGFLFCLKNNEQCGAFYAGKILSGYGYSQAVCSKVSDLILATCMPQKPCCKLAEILCDADLEALGNAEIFEATSEALRQELTFWGEKFDDRQWIEFEISFLSNHRYFTSYAKRTRDAVKKKHLEQFIKKRGN